jgi:two-component system, sensor histidine kinase
MQTFTESSIECLNGATVLLVDDAPDVLLLCSRLLQVANTRILKASNGLEALEILQTEAPTVVIMDLQMPVVTGFEAVKRMRECGYKVPVLAMTAHALDYACERKNCLRLGFDELITKPFQRSNFLATTAGLIHNSTCYEFLHSPI